MNVCRNLIGRYVKRRRTFGDETNETISGRKRDKLTKFTISGAKNAMKVSKVSDYVTNVTLPLYKSHFKPKKAISPK